MGKFAGGALRLFSTFIYFLEFLCAGICLSIFSYFLAKLSLHHLHIKTDWKAVEGLSGVAVIYTVCAVLLTCFLGGSRFFAIVAVVFDLAFCGAFIAIAVLTNDGADKCTGIVHTPLGTGLARLQSAGTHLSLACKLNKTVFAVSIAAAAFFLISVILQLFMMRHHQAEKKYGPSPANNYTSGSGSSRFQFWKRKPMTTHDAYATYNPEMAPANGGLNRNSDIGGSTYTGTTDTYGAGQKYDTYTAPQIAPPQTGPYHTNPTGSAVNY